MSVCLFVMHSVPVIAIVTKLSTIFPLVQRKVDMGLESLRKGRRGVPG